jgi:Zn-dependent M28 family amino/carboxypeptidase
MNRRKITIGIACVLALPLVAQNALAGPKSCDKRVNNTQRKLQECVTVDGVRAHQAAFQAIADENGDTRASGTPGYDESVDYVADLLEDAGYDVTVQPFEFNAFIQIGPSTLEQIAPDAVEYVENTDYNLMSQTDAGDVTGLVTGVDLALGTAAWPADPSTSTSGCEVADFAAFPAGNIALIQRGACAFGLKADNAADAGAVGVIIFNQGNAPDRLGLINGTLGNDYSGGIPVQFATHPRGQEWAATAGLEMHMIADVVRGITTTYNVLAESSKGDSSNTVMVGAHLDSVGAGPGIQDNGSGSAAILETALQMAKVKPRNKLRFAWWGAEESGLVGSTYYVDNLTEEEQDDITLYLNFDMVGSPNFFRGIYDGDDSDGLGAGPGPEGSAQIEKFFEDFYTENGLAFQGTDFSGRSDYGPFIAVGIPAGGLFTGAEGIKTDDEVAIYGGTAGEQYDPCYHLACDTFDNVSLEVLDQNSDAIAAATLQYAMNTEEINGQKGKGNFKREPAKGDAESLGPMKVK